MTKKYSLLGNNVWCGRLYVLCEFYCLFCCCVPLKVRIHCKTIEIPAALATVAMAMAMAMAMAVLMLEYIVIVLVVGQRYLLLLELFFSCSREVLVHDQDSETSMG